MQCSAISAIRRAQPDRAVTDIPVPWCVDRETGLRVKRAGAETGLAVGYAAGGERPRRMHKMQRAARSGGFVEEQNPRRIMGPVEREAFLARRTRLGA